MRIIKSHNHIIFIIAMLPVVSTLAMAETVNLHCKGVNYIYESGMGNGTAKRETASRTIKLDLQEMTAEMVNSNEVHTTHLIKKYGDYHGFFPGEKNIFYTKVLGEQIEINSTFDLLELRYLLENEKKFLSFTGICKRRY